MITLISCGIQKSDVTEFACNIIKKSDILLGGKRFLESLDFPIAKKVILDTKLINNLELFLNSNINKNIVILATGDSLFYGIGNMLSKIIKHNNLTIIPNITAMQALFAKIKQPWQDSRFFSVHGREKILPFLNILSNKMSVIYCDEKMTASQVAEKLIDFHPECRSRNAVVAENLGSDDEKIVKNPLYKIKNLETSGLSILVILPNDLNFVSDPGIPLGISDFEFSKNSNCITHSEVRSIVLSKLKLGNGVMWDLGAGRGSVGIEAALLANSLEVYAIEKNKERVEQIEENRQKFGAISLKIINAPILDEIDKLPSPRSVFVGGGGDDISEIIEKSYKRLLPGGRIVATSVLIETSSSLSNILKEFCTEILSVSINRAMPLADKKLMKSDNTITIFVYEKPYEK